MGQDEVINEATLSQAEENENASDISSDSGEEEEEKCDQDMNGDEFP